jgi:glycosyltransferase involved in cell wall biosynthesis
MTEEKQKVRVLYSFPHKLGADRICYIAWHQVNGLAMAGADVLVLTGALARPAPEGIKVRTTLARGKLRLPYKVLGSMRTFALHDYLVSRGIQKLVGKIDIIHTWPQGAERTLRSAARLGIPTVLERCNAHTRYSYEVVRKECERLGVALPPGHESAFNEDVLRLEEEEFRLADRLLCPSEFVVQTFLDRGFTRDKLPRHIYGFDEKRYYPDPERPRNGRGLDVLFVGVCAVRKGLHFALEAWLQSPAHHDGTFTIAGEFLPDYAAKLAPMLSHPSVRVLGHRNDVPELMRRNDILLLPSLEEGFGLVCTEAMGSGCVPLVSDACTDVCRHMENALVHRVGDVQALTQHITTLHGDRALLERLRANGLSGLSELTWDAAGIRLLDVYRETIAMHQRKSIPEPRLPTEGDSRPAGEGGQRSTKNRRTPAPESEIVQ